MKQQGEKTNGTLWKHEGLLILFHSSPATDTPTAQWSGATASGDMFSEQVDFQRAVVVPLEQWQ